MPLIASQCRRALLTLAYAALVVTPTGCELFRTGEPQADAEWREVGEAQQRWFVNIPDADPWSALPAPVVTPEGVIFPLGSGRIISLDPSTGAQRFILAPPSGVSGISMSYANGVLYSPTSEGAVALDLRAPANKWEYASPLDVRMSELVPKPGQHGYTGTARLTLDGNTAYLPAWGGSLSAIDVATGEPRWVWSDSVNFPNPAGTTGAAVSGDTVYLHAWHLHERGRAESELSITSVDRLSGKTLWYRVLPEEGYGTTPWVKPAVAGGLLIVQQFTRVLALNRTTGEIVWTFSDGAAYFPDVAATDAGRIYLGTRRDAPNGAGDEILAVSATDGKLVWRSTVYFAPNKDLVLSPTRIIATDGYFLSVLDRATGKLLLRVKAPGEGGMVSPPAVAGGVLYVRVGLTLKPGVYQDAVWSIILP